MKLKLTHYNKKALWGGAIATASVTLGVFFLGHISQHEAKVLIKESLPGFNMLCNTVVLASATILALLLTLLGISTSSDTRLKESHYKQVALIAKWDAIVFISAIILFQLSNIPLTEADNFPNDFFSILYWITLGTSSLLVGGIVSVILMLYNTVNNIISIVGLNISDHPLSIKEDDDG